MDWSKLLKTFFSKQIRPWTILFLIVLFSVLIYQTCNNRSFKSPILEINTEPSIHPDTSSKKTDSAVIINQKNDGKNIIAPVQGDVNTEKIEMK